MILPSKELLSEVLYDRITDIQFLSSDVAFFGGKSMWVTGDRIDDVVDIYELMHKMKDYIFNIGYTRFGTTRSTSVQGWFLWLDDIDTIFTAETEFEAVTKACEWILKNKK